MKFYSKFIFLISKKHHHYNTTDVIFNLSPSSGSSKKSHPSLTSSVYSSCSRNSPTTTSASGRTYMSSRVGLRSRGSSSVSRIGRWTFSRNSSGPNRGCNSSTTAWATPYRRRATARLYYVLLPFFVAGVAYVVGKW